MDEVEGTRPSAAVDFVATTRDLSVAVVSAGTTTAAETAATSAAAAMVVTAVAHAAVSVPAVMLARAASVATAVPASGKWCISHVRHLFSSPDPQIHSGIHSDQSKALLELLHSQHSLNLAPCSSLPVLFRHPGLSALAQNLCTNSRRFISSKFVMRIIPTPLLPALSFYCPRLCVRVGVYLS